jgi:hypothetical protein
MLNILHTSTTCLPTFQVPGKLNASSSVMLRTIKSLKMYHGLPISDSTSASGTGSNVRTIDGFRTGLRTFDNGYKVRRLFLDGHHERLTAHKKKLCQHSTVLKHTGTHPQLIHNRIRIIHAFYNTTRLTCLRPGSHPHTRSKKPPIPTIEPELQMILAVHACVDREERRKIAARDDAPGALRRELLACLACCAIGHVAHECVAKD